MPRTRNYIRACFNRTSIGQDVTPLFDGNPVYPLDRSVRTFKILPFFHNESECCGIAVPVQALVDKPQYTFMTSNIWPVNANTGLDRASVKLTVIGSFCVGEPIKILSASPTVTVLIQYKYVATAKRFEQMFLNEKCKV